MKFGANSFIWRSPFSTDSDLDLLAKVKGMGFDVFEVAVEEPDQINLRALKAAVDEQKLDVVVCGAFGPGRNLSSLDEEERNNASKYLHWLIDAAQFLDADTVCGPMYSAVGKPRLVEAEDRAREWQYAVDGLREAAGYAADRGVKLAFEPLNRFETDLINIVDQGLNLIDEVGSSNIGFHLDTFHMHLEEKDSAAAVRKAGEKIFHVHASENDRGVPGTGQVDWPGIFEALRDVGYDRNVVIESFTPQVSSIARAVCIWREIAPDQDTIAREGLKFLKSIPLTS